MKQTNELNQVCEELGIKKISFFPSPKGGNNQDELTTHAVSMLRNYQRYKNGDELAPVKEIFID